MGKIQARVKREENWSFSKALSVKPITAEKLSINQNKPRATKARSFSDPGREPAPVTAHGRILTQSCHLYVGSAPRKSVRTGRNRIQEDTLWCDFLEHLLGALTSSGTQCTHLPKGPWRHLCKGKEK